MSVAKKHFGILIKTQAAAAQDQAQIRQEDYKFEASLGDIVSRYVSEAKQTEESVHFPGESNPWLEMCGSLACKV